MFYEWRYLVKKFVLNFKKWSCFGNFVFVLYLCKNIVDLVVLYLDSCKSSIIFD